tara:strand:+ start:1813 stop:2022 length:210 start_codon:yes stop_codon:yes gene_type:complete
MELHKELSLNDKNWHSKKSDPEIRAAELLINALSQLINDGEVIDIENLLLQAIKWLKREVKDPGCPRHH